MNAPREKDAVPTEDPADELNRLVNAITSLEAVVAGWDQSHALTLQALKSAIEDLHREALRRLIRHLKEDPACLAQLRGALADPIVFGVLSFHGLIREPLSARVEKALEEVRPFMHEHGGDVELVAVRLPDSVDVRLLGSCHGCPASSQTLTEGVEKAIRAHCPEIVHINQVSKGVPESRSTPSAAKDAAGQAVVQFVSPFARRDSAGWQDALPLAAITEGGITEHKIGTRSLLLSRVGAQVSCFDNRCAHLGMSLEMGEVRDGVITCSYHGFQYLLETGECLTAPEVQLTTHAVRVIGGRVQVRIEGLT
ncbi:MAG: NifU family protein [Burkholderiaceae bacterium]|jgi:nitrite reductase/ring-hydroxylating ferredoxin subunit/Fe-S cluster biogenesis protein NfuA